MTRMLFLVLAVLCLPAQAAFGHPHSFVECTFSFVMDENGLVGFHQCWVLDEMTTVAVLDVVDTDHDFSLSKGEKLAVRNLSVNSLKKFHYFTVARVNGRDFPVETITDFSAEVKDGKLHYDFLVPCRVEAVAGKPHQVEVAVYDSSFYTYVTYVEQGDTGINPSKDPLFGNRDAPARPGDFKRFSQAVGMAQFAGKVRVEGDAGKFKVTSGVKDAPDMAYFYGQIIPQSFLLKFETP